MSYPDILFHNHQDSLDNMKSANLPAAQQFLRHPVFTQDVKNYDRKNYILYAGRIAPDKGVHYVIDALSVLNKQIPFKIITAGNVVAQKFIKDHALHLNVDLEIIENCSEADKWKMYHECRFTVCGADSPHIAGLSPLEGISVGRLGIVFDTPENRIHYDRFAMYCIMRDINSLAHCIDLMYNQPKTADDYAQDGSVWCQENCSIEKWAADIYAAYQKKKGFA
jgi:glycosyltransferase involved in cell wall biosynthesis